MPSLAKFALTACVALTLGATAAVAATYEQAQADVDSAGGGALQGGAYTAFTTIATTGDAGPMRGGAFEATAGLERRRADERGDAIFSDGFEG